MGTNHKNAQDLLNRSAPIAADVKLGDLMQELIDKHNAVLAKLDADAGVTGTNYAALHSIDSLNSRAG